MGIGTIIKKAGAYTEKNLGTAWNFMHKTATGASYARFMAAGAAVGGLYGLADNMVNDRVSVMGGMLQGAMMGAGIRGLGSMWGARGAMRAARSASGTSAIRAAVGGPAQSMSSQLLRGRGGFANSTRTVNMPSARPMGPLSAGGINSPSLNVGGGMANTAGYAQYMRKMKAGYWGR